MNHKKLNMTEEELIDYCASLNELELKAFQLECKQHDIDSAKRKAGFALCNLIVCLLAGIYAIQIEQTILTIALGVISVLALLFVIGFNKRIKQEKMMYRMLEIWYKENKIL